MQLTNPTWIHHSGGAIYSIDFHPYGTKLATCGQGSEGGSGLVVIWNVKPITNEKKAQDSCCPRMLSRMLHQACVNCVRWSPDGSLLACGGDDHALTIWEFGGKINSAGTIGSKDGINVEKYREKHRLYGHTMDILHLEWSKDGRFLASCGMDNTTIIWDATNFPYRITVLDKNRDGHDASVKGLSWDPIGKFLVTQAADKSLRIWRTDNWRCVKVIKEPFVESNCFLKPYLYGNNAIITSFKGLRLQVSCFAVGSRDKTLSVWLIPRVDRPLIVLHKLFKHSILDFSWLILYDFHLIICSMDGSVKSVVFNENEVGHLLSAMEMVNGSFFVFLLVISLQFHISVM
uniref:WD_REPEATS_REGION domain-containing protein n=1 Tax=Syphacia muris TaxID=451379 RepID=A0A0N5AP30_9BILA